MNIFDQFKAWVATKAGEYEYYDTRNCPLAQFGKEVLGFKVPSGGSIDVWDLDAEGDNMTRVIPRVVGADGLELHSPLYLHPRTFEGLSKRLEDYPNG